MSNSEKKQLEAMLKQAQSLCESLSSMLSKEVVEKPKTIKVPKPKRPTELKGLKTKTIDFLKAVQGAYGSQWVYPNTPEIKALADGCGINTYINWQIKKLSSRNLVEYQKSGTTLLRFRVLDKS